VGKKRESTLENLNAKAIAILLDHPSPQNPVKKAREQDEEGNGVERTAALPTIGASGGEKKD